MGLEGVVSCRIIICSVRVGRGGDRRIPLIRKVLPDRTALSNCSVKSSVARLVEVVCGTVDIVNMRTLPLWNCLSSLNRGGPSYALFLG